MKGLQFRDSVWQRALFAILRLLFVASPPRKTSSPRVALLRFDKRIGEVILQTPLFAALKRQHADMHTIAVVHPRMRRVLEGQPNIDEIFEFSLRGFPFALSAWKRLFGLLRLRVDIAIDCSNYAIFSTSHVAASLLTRAPQRIGFDRGNSSAQCFSHALEPLPGVASERRQRLHLLTALGIHADDETTHFVPRAKHSPDVQKMLATVSTNPGAFAVLNPGGRLSWRRVDTRSFEHVANKLIELGKQPIVVWGPGERDLAVGMCLRIGKQAILAPPTNIDELAALMAAVACTITNNTGPMHLSIAVAAPTLAIFLGMSSQRWGDDRWPHMIVDISEAADAAPILTHAVEAFVEHLRQQKR